MGIDEPGWLVRVLNDNGEGVGTGIAVDGAESDDVHVITCAHVLEHALGIKLSSSAELTEISIEFPMLEPGLPRTAVVIDGGWYPSDGVQLGDFAVLQVKNPPENLEGAPLRKIRHFTGRNVVVRGYPDRALAMAPAMEAKLSSVALPGQIQIDPVAPRGWTIQRGFSGGPVWDAQHQAVIGMVIRKDSHDCGYMLTLQFLSQLWYGITERLQVPMISDMRDMSHWDPRSRGVTRVSEPGWRFRGRTAALERIVDYLDAADQQGPLTITGSPGVGKSAVLARVVTTSHEPWACALPQDDTAVRAAPGSVSCAIHAKNKTALDIAQIMIETAGGKSINELDEFTIELRRVLKSEEQFNVVIDALDEAVSADETRKIITEIINPASRLPKLKMIISTRRSDGRGRLLRFFGGENEFLDLDDPEYFAIEDLQAYVESTLRLDGDIRPSNPYNDPESVAPVARRIAELSGQNFLVAGLQARAHGLTDIVPAEPSEIDFSNDVHTAFWDYLDRIPGIGSIEARTLITSLAYAESPGLTSELWAIVILALFGQEVRPQQLEEFARTSAAAFLIESFRSEEIVYQIFHQALIDACIEESSSSSDPALSFASKRRNEERITRSLLELADRVGWQNVGPYIKSAIPGHAARAGMVDELLRKPEIMVYVEADRLAAILDEAVTDEGLACASIYRNTEAAVEGSDDSRYREFLSYNAARQGSRDLARRIASIENDQPLPWVPEWATGSGFDSRLRSRLNGRDDWISSVASIEIYGRPMAVTAGDSSILCIWDLRQGEVFAEIKTDHATGVSALACIEVDGIPIAVTGGPDGRISTWDLEKVRAIKTSVYWHEGRVEVISCDDLDGQPVAVSVGAEGTVHVIDLRTRKLIGDPIEGDEDWVRAVACLKFDGQPIVLTAGIDGMIWAWQISETISIYRILSGHNGWVRALAVVDIGGETRLVTGGDDGTLRIWDLRSGEAQGPSIKCGCGPIEAVSCTTINSEVVAVVAGMNGSVESWNIISRQRLGMPFYSDDGDFQDVACNVIDGIPVAVTAGSYGVIRIWDLVDRLPNNNALSGHESDVALVSVFESKGSSIVVSAGWDRKLRCWDANRGRSIGNPIDFGHSASELKELIGFDLDGSPCAITVDNRNHIRLWNLRQSDLIHETFRYGAIERLRLRLGMFRDSPLLISIDEFGQLEIWDLRSRRFWACVPVKAPRIREFIFCLDWMGKPSVVVWCVDDTIRVIDVKSGTPIVEPVYLNDSASQFAGGVFNDIPMVLSVDDSNMLQCWDLGRQTLRFQFEVPNDFANPQLMFSGGSYQVGFIGESWNVHLYDGISGSELSVIHLPDPVLGFSVASQGKLAIAAGQDVSYYRSIADPRSSEHPRK